MEEMDVSAVAVAGLPQTWILESDSIDRLLLLPGRRLLGLARQQVAFASTVTWMRALKEKKLLPDDPMQVCTVTVLAEGIGHNLPGALATVLDSKTHRGDNWVGVSRFALDKKEADPYTPFDARVTYMRMHSPAPTWCMLDTVGTGATLVKGLDALFKNAEKPRRILLATPAGSVAGMRKIAELCWREGVELHITFFGAAFGLWVDGTALPWCHPDTIFSGTPRSRRNRELAGELFNNLPGFCSVGDCSANFFDVQQALAILQEEEERFSWKLPADGQLEPARPST